MKLNIIGTIFGQSGYDSHTRQLANAMMEEGVDVTLSVNRPQGWERYVNDNELLALQKNPDSCDIDLAIALPQQWPMLMNHPNKKFIGFCVWEGDRVPDSWIDIFLDSKVSQIWVPSNHTKNAILNTAQGLELGFISHKIRVIPHGVNPKLFYPKENKRDNTFTFFTDGGWKDGIYDRKGISYLIKAFNEEFTSKDNVQLLVKLNTVYGQNLSMPQTFPEDNKDLPKISMIANQVSLEQLNDFYNVSDVFVISSLAEGFHLGGIQAMACSKPVISTSFGGMTDYINSENGWSVSGEFFEVKHDIQYEGIQWVKPNLNQLKRTLRHVYEHKDEVKASGLKALDTSKKFTWKESAKKAIQSIKEII
jgi:glycosyltransferase involved in cell wall biosynthesis